ncbi:MAG: hypothetical protein M1835_007237 [Candelina submexicana]|nr:MAG: hypothetical protein M1835_007237 [Candelina submexicana]
MPRQQRSRPTGRPTKRNLVRWSDEMNNQLLLCIQSTMNAKGQRLPWEDIAETLGDTINAPTITDGAIIQHLAKMRSNFVNRGTEVPPPLRRGGASGPVPRVGGGSCGAAASRANIKPKRTRAHGVSVSDDDEEGDVVDVDRASDSDEEYGRKTPKRAKLGTRITKRATTTGSRKVTKPTVKRGKKESSDSDDEVKVEGPSAVAIGKRKRTSVSPKRGRRTMTTRGGGSRVNYAKLAGNQTSSVNESSTERSSDSHSVKGDRVGEDADWLQFTGSDEEMSKKKNVIIWPESNTNDGQLSKVLTLRFSKDRYKALQKIVGSNTDTEDSIAAGAAMAKHEIGDTNEVEFKEYAGELALSNEFDSSRFGGVADEFGYSAPEPVENEYAGPQGFHSETGSNTFNLVGTSGGAGPSSFQGSSLDRFSPSNFPALNHELLTFDDMLRGTNTTNDFAMQSFNLPSSSGNIITGVDQNPLQSEMVATSQSAGPGVEYGLATGASSNQITPGFATGDLANDFSSTFDGLSADGLVPETDPFHDFLHFDLDFEQWN